MKKVAFIFALLLVAGSVFAGSADIFGAYEHARQGLLKASLPETQAGARHLSMVARQEKLASIAARADALAAAREIAGARQAFGSLSEEMMKYRGSVSGEKPVVAYCSMEKKHWLQPRGAITNPYFDGAMRSCGELKQN